MNLFMEHHHLNSSLLKPITWFHFIENIFILWHDMSQIDVKVFPYCHHLPCCVIHLTFVLIIIVLPIKVTDLFQNTLLKTTRLSICQKTLFPIVTHAQSHNSQFNQFFILAPPKFIPPAYQKLSLILGSSSSNDLQFRQVLDSTSSNISLPHTTHFFTPWHILYPSFICHLYMHVCLSVYI